MIELAQVSKAYGAATVIRELSFAVRPGEIVGLLGPNGSGKTTTIRLLCGVIAPDQGTIAVGGFDPVHDGDRIRAQSGILTESAGFYLHLTGLQNLCFFADLYGVTDRQWPLELLEEFGLTAARDRKVGAYSTGMKKRLGLAKALLHRPRILFLDEPTNGLDPEGIRMVLDAITTLNRRDGTTIILCSHLLNQMEAVCHRYLFIHQGRLIAQGTLPELEAQFPGETVLEVETDLPLDGDAYHGVPARRLAPGRIAFTLGGRQAVPAFLRDLTRAAAVFGATIADRDLQSLYFRVQEATRHE